MEAKKVGLRRARAAIMAAAVLVCLVAVGLVMLTHSGTARSVPNEAATPAPWYEIPVISDEILQQAVLQYLGESWVGQSELNEVLMVTSRIKPFEQDMSSWCTEWYAEAEKVRHMGLKAAQKHHARSAGVAYLRAATYYRACLNRTPTPTGPIANGVAMKDVAVKAMQCHTRALKLLGIGAKRVLIPYAGTTIPGYFYRTAKKGAPTIIVFNGRDAWAQDGHYIGLEGKRRGYNILLFDGPGQGETLRLRGLPFRYDWEKVVKPVVSWVISQRGVDRSRIAMWGLSKGGGLVLRAAAYERRVKVAISDPGVPSWGKVVRDWIGSFDPSLVALLDTDPAAFDQQMNAYMDAVPLLKWSIEDEMWKDGCTTPSEMMLSCDKFESLSVLDKIKCKVLCVEGAIESFGDSRAVLSALRCPKSFIFFDDESPAQLHCQVGSPATASAAVYDWLDENFGN